MLRLHDTSTGHVRELAQRESGKVSMYVCGGTVYDEPHVGHGRLFVVWDVLRRYLQWSGVEVRFVSNVTDIDDKIIQRANEQHVSTDDIVARYEPTWTAAMAALGVAAPDDTPHATDWVAQMVDLVGQLVERGAAYETADGVYFSVESVPGYGLLARQPLDSLRSGARVEVDDGKRSPLDFVLWKKAKPGEPTWPSPWGDGRPGWHTECVVMSLGLLGDGFDLHGGGIDLAFPHHENERAQALAAGHEFARHWTHSGHVVVGSEKMSKSLGNFTTLPDLLARIEPRAFRLLLLQAHYRAPQEVMGEAIDRARAALSRLDTLDQRAVAAHLAEVPVPAEHLDRFRAAMDDDLDTPAAVALIFELARAANTALDELEHDRAAGLVAAVRELTGALGLELRGGADVLDEDTAALVARRDTARLARDWAEADAVRDELVAAGWLVEDTAEGTRVRRP